MPSRLASSGMGLLLGHWAVARKVASSFACDKVEELMNLGKWDRFSRASVPSMNGSISSCPCSQIPMCRTTLQGLYSFKLLEDGSILTMAHGQHSFLSPMMIRLQH